MIMSDIVNFVVFKADLNNLSEAETFIDNIIASNQFSQDLYGNVLIAVTEAVNNAIIHGSQNSDNEVKVSCENSNGKLTFVVEDEGAGFDFENLPDPTAPENIEMENGRGVFLMRSLADEVVFENDGRKVLISFNG